MSPRRSYAAALGLLLVGSVVVVLSAGRWWGSAEVAGTSSAARSLHARGTDVSAVLPALGLLAVASVLAVISTGGVLRRSVGVLLALIGLTVAAIAATGDVGAALDSAARTAAGATSARATDTSATAWRWVCLLGGLLITSAGAVTALRSGGWVTLGARFYRLDPVQRVRIAHDAWTQLDQGIDPTADLPDTMPAKPTDQPEAPAPEEQP